MISRIRSQYLKSPQQWRNRGMAMLMQTGVPRFVPNWPKGFLAGMHRRFDDAVLDVVRLNSLIAFHEAAMRDPTHIQVLRNAVHLTAIELFVELTMERTEE